MSKLPEPQRAPAVVQQRLVLLFERDGFYAVENYDRHGNIHRICQVRGGKVRYMANDWEPVEDYFTDYDGKEWEGLKVVYLPEFSEQNNEVRDAANE